MHFPAHSFTLFASLISINRKVVAQTTAGVLLAAAAHEIDVPDALDIDTSTLPTFLVVASGSVPEYTGAIPALIQPEVTEDGDEVGHLQALQHTEAASPTKSATEEQVTEITTTMLTVANGTTAPAALTTTVPVSILKTEEEQGYAQPKSFISHSLSLLAVLLPATLLSC